MPDWGQVLTHRGGAQGHDETLPNVSPDESDAGQDQNGIPRLWAPGDTPRGLRERQQRQQHEQMQLMGVNAANGDAKRVAQGLAPAANPSHSAMLWNSRPAVEAAHEQQFPHAPALTPQRMKYQHILLAEQQLPLRASNPGVKASDQHAMHPVHPTPTEVLREPAPQGNLRALSAPVHGPDATLRLKEDLELSRETIAVQKELIAKLEAHDSEQRRLLLQMTHERDLLREQVPGARALSLSAHAGSQCWQSLDYST